MFVYLFNLNFIYQWASLVAQTVKNLPAMQRPRFDPWFGKIPWRRKWQPTPVFLPGEFQGQRSLAHRVTKNWTWLTNTFTLSLKSLTWPCYPTVNLLPPSPTYKCFLNLWSSHPTVSMTSAFKCSTSIPHSICLKLTHCLPYQTRPLFFNFCSPTLGLPWCVSK